MARDSWKKDQLEFRLCCIRAELADARMRIIESNDGRRSMLLAAVGIATACEALDGAIGRMLMED